MNNKINYPIWRDDKSRAWIIKQHENISIINSIKIKNRYWNNVIIIDSLGMMYKVNHIEQLGYAGFYGYTLKYSGRYIRAIEKYEIIKQINLEEFKEYIINFLHKYNKNLEIFQFSDQKKEIKKIIESDSIKEIFDILDY